MTAYEDTIDESDTIRFTPCKQRYTNNQCSGCEGEAVLKIGVIDNEGIGCVRNELKDKSECSTCKHHINNKCSFNIVHYPKMKCSTYEKADTHTCGNCRHYDTSVNICHFRKEYTKHKDWCSEYQQTTYKRANKSKAKKNICKECEHFNMLNRWCKINDKSVKTYDPACNQYKSNLNPICKTCIHYNAQKNICEDTGGIIYTTKKCSGYKKVIMNLCKDCKGYTGTQYVGEWCRTYKKSLVANQKACKRYRERPKQSTYEVQTDDIEDLPF